MTETLPERLHMQAKFYNISYPSLAKLLREAAEEIDYKDRCIVGYGALDAAKFQDATFMIQELSEDKKELIDACTKQRERAERDEDILVKINNLVSRFTW